MTEPAARRRGFTCSDRKTLRTAQVKTMPSSMLAAGFTLIELLVSIAIIAVLAGILAPSFSKAKGQASSIGCRSNLHQLGLALRLYADDNEGRLPALKTRGDAEAAPLALQDLLRNVPLRCYHCQADKAGYSTLTGSSYDWNEALNGRLLHRVSSEPADCEATILLSDHAPWHGYRNALFADGHAARLSK